jgi:hypothetical protein
MSQLPNSREKWFSERPGLEAVSRYVCDPNLFLTVNMDPRAWPDVRNLIYKLEHDNDMSKNYPFERNTERFTELMNKYAVHISIYLYRKVKYFLNTFLHDICGVSKNEVSDWSKQDKN